MAFVRSEPGSGNIAASTQAAPRSSRLARLAVISGVGLAFAACSLTALASLVFLATSLTSPTDFAPQAQKAATRGHLALAAASYSLPALENCRLDCRQRTQYIVQQAKAARMAKAADQHLDTQRVAAEAVTKRFELAHASLTHQKLTSAIVQARSVAAAAAPSKDRLYPAVDLASLSNDNGPDAARFGPSVPEVDRSSRVALALAGSGTLHDVAYPVQTASLAPAMPLLAPQADDDAIDMAEAPVFDAAPDSVPLPARRPKVETRQPAAVAEAPAPRQPAAAAEAAAPRRLAAVEQPATRRSNKPTQIGRGADQQALAYAAPGDDAPSVGQAFKNLFSSPNAGNGVAVYNISAQTVTMPDGQVLEAHSGIGHMADDPRYANQKMNGPTPPNTYKLVMRESRFHGVEAIRMLPVDGKNKYGRTGILAHSYLLRGRTAQSHGCVAFADYNRFLKAFKQGKVKHIVVVPGRGKSGTRIAKNGRST